MVLVGVSSRKSIWSNASIVFLSVTKTLHNVVLSDRILQQQLFYLLSQRWTRQTKNERLHEFDLSAQCFLAPLTAFRLAHSALIPLVPHTSQIYSIYIYILKSIIDFLKHLAIVVFIRPSSNKKTEYSMRQSLLLLHRLIELYWISVLSALREEKL